jgi:hypothetical protein
MNTENLRDQAQERTWAWLKFLRAWAPQDPEDWPYNPGVRVHYPDPEREYPCSQCGHWVLNTKIHYCSG